MSIEIDWQENPPKKEGHNTDEPTNYYPRIKNSRKVGDSEIFQKASKKSIVTRGNFPPAVYGIAKAIAQELMNGNIVTLNDLGTFKLQIGTEEPISQKKKENLAKIIIKGINFTPSQDFLELLSSPTFTWTPEHVINKKLNEEEILNTLHVWFETHESITRKQFQELFQMSRTTSTNWLNKLISKNLISKFGNNIDTKYRLIYRK